MQGEGQSSLPRLHSGEAFLICGSEPQTSIQRQAPSPCIQVTLSPVLGLSGTLTPAQPQTSQGTSAQPSCLNPTCHLHTGGDFGLSEHRHHNSSRKNECHYTRPSAHVNWAPSQADSPAGTRNLIISAHIPAAPLIFQNTFYISCLMPGINL